MSDVRSSPGTNFRGAGFKGLFSVRARLVVLALIMVVPFMADRVRTLESSRANQARALSVQLLNSARNNAEAQREMVSSIEALLKTISYSATAGAASGQFCGMIRSSFNVDLPWITSLMVAGANGKIVCSTSPNYDGINLDDRPYFQSALQTHQMVLSSYVLNKTTGQPALLAAYSAPAAAGEPQFVAVAGISLQWMTRLMSGLRNRPGVIGSVVDAHGTVLARSEGDDRIGHRITDQSLFNLLKTQEAGSTTAVAADGSRRVVSFARIPDTGLNLIINVDETRIVGDIDRDIRSAYLQLTLVSIAVLLGAWMLGERLILRPIRVLTTMTARLGMGDFSTRSDRTALPPEFAQLAAELNIMANQLGERERELRASNNQLSVLASLDSLSGLANRRGFDSRLGFEWVRAEHSGHQLALMMIDIDHFKLFNDTYGHLEGDACLRHVGETLAAIADEVVGFAARYGGEEFSLMIPAINAERASEIGEMVRTAIERLNVPHSAAPLGYLTVSIGIAVDGPRPDNDATALVEAADASLYAAKRRGRNLVVEHTEIRADDGAVPVPVERMRA
jgi:diguanylate cyclase (GGDEF)-like protein